MLDRIDKKWIVLMSLSYPVDWFLVAMKLPSNFTVG